MPKQHADNHEDGGTKAQGVGESGHQAETQDDAIQDGVPRTMTKLVPCLIVVEPAQDVVER